MPGHPGRTKAIPPAISPLPAQSVSVGDTPLGSPPTDDYAEPWQAGLGSSREFSFDHQPPGRYVLVLRCGSYAAMSEAPVEVRAGETTDGVTLRLRRGAPLSGRVSDARGVPRAFTRVRVADDGGALTLDTWTDPDGGYEILGLWPGDWTAAVGEEGAADFARGRARVTGDAAVRLDLRPAAPR